MQSEIYTDATLATMQGSHGYGLIEDGAIVVEEAKIKYVGSCKDIPARFSDVHVTSLDGRLITPGLIDCHTHLVHAGSRVHEFEQRLEGMSYEEISRAEGGIFSTVEATRNASEEELLEEALRRLDNLLAEGITTVEIKSGYGLDIDTEFRMLRVADRLSERRNVRVSKTFLGAHAIPKTMTPEVYLDEICLPALHKCASEGLVDMVDGFCETVAFTPVEIERVFKDARDLGLPVKLHAEQLSDQEGAQLAARYGARSADHLEYISPEGVAAMATAGTVAVLLPGAFYFLRETKVPPVQMFRDAGVKMALATDSNPGSSPMTSLLLAMNMGATLFGLTPMECLRAVTVNAARALGYTDIGKLEVGMCADLAIWDISHPAELAYRMGDAPLYKRIYRGVSC